MKNLIFLLALPLLFISCKKEEVAAEDDMKDKKHVFEFFHLNTSDETAKMHQMAYLYVGDNPDDLKLKESVGGGGNMSPTPIDDDNVILIGNTLDAKGYSVYKAELRIYAPDMNGFEGSISTDGETKAKAVLVKGEDQVKITGYSCEDGYFETYQPSSDTIVISYCVSY